MKQKLLTVLFLLLSIPFYAQWWVPQDSGVTSNLNDVYCLTANTVLVVGDGGVILKTTDGGENWIQKTSGTVQFLRKIQFANSTTGYAAGGSGTLLKTTDAGESWNPIATGITTDLLGLSVFNESTFYISGNNGLIQRTDDGSATFIDQSYGENPVFNNIQLLDQNTAFASSYDYYGADSNAFLKTTDGGLNWTLEPDQNTAYFYFMDENVGFLKNGTGFHKTTDGGMTLTDFMTTSDEDVNDMFATNQNTLWQVGSNYMLCNCAFFCIRKADFTDPLMPEAVQNCYADTDGGLPFEAIHFANETTGYIVGWGGKILKNSTGHMEELAVNEFDDQDFVKTYPNPSSGLVNITFKDKQSAPFSIEITDVLGKKAFAQSYQNQNDIAINIESFSHGVYFLKLQSDRGSTIKKLVRQ